jgi:hypothetical protein
MTTYTITKEIRIHHNEENWFYQFTDDDEGCIEVSSYETYGIQETKTGQTLHIPKDVLEQFISVLQYMK